MYFWGISFVPQHYCCTQLIAFAVSEHFIKQTGNKLKKKKKITVRYYCKEQL